MLASLREPLVNRCNQPGVAAPVIAVVLSPARTAYRRFEPTGAPLWAQAAASLADAAGQPGRVTLIDSPSGARRDVAEHSHFVDMSRIIKALE